jgi:hypothetical protein
MSACASTTNITIDKGKSPDNSNDNTISTNELIQLHKESRICVFVPKDGMDTELTGKIIAGSGSQTANIVSDILGRYFQNINLEQDTDDLNLAIKNTRQKGYDYIVYPKILTWTNYATFWSGVPNKLAVNLRIYDVKNKKLVDSIIIENESSELVKPGFQTSDLLRKPLNNVANQLIYS